jgi:hypothetical protein
MENHSEQKSIEFKPEEMSKEPLPENKLEEVKEEIKQEVVQIEVKQEVTQIEVKEEVKLEEVKQEVKQEVTQELKQEEVKKEEHKPEPPKLTISPQKLTLNTHDYDGKLRELANYLLEKYSAEVTFDESINEIRQFTQEVNYHRKGEVFRCLEIFISDKNNNYDNTNNVRIENILPKLWSIIRKWEKDGKLVLLEQLADTIHGSCSQGRNTRLLQLFP